MFHRPTLSPLSALICRRTTGAFMNVKAHVHVHMHVCVCVEGGGGGGRVVMCVQGTMK